MPRSAPGQPPVGFVVNERGFASSGSAYPIPARPGSPSPALAFFLGLIPGVGAIYNGQYAKGIVHGLIWGTLVSIVDSRAVHGLEPLFGMLIVIWEAYMAFEAHHTAKKLLAGQPVDEFSSLVNFRGDHAALAGVLLVLFGVVLLLRTMDILNIDEVLSRYWPVLLIAAGAWLLWGRISGSNAAPARTAEARHER
jgi:TM2 domain-containing membrane protein YozV